MPKSSISSHQTSTQNPLHGTHTHNTSSLDPSTSASSSPSLTSASLKPSFSTMTSPLALPSSASSSILYAIASSQLSTPTIPSLHSTPLPLMTFALSRRLFLSTLPSNDIDVANDVTVDHCGNAFVTNSRGNFIWKDSTGIAYISKGYLLVVQSSTGKMFKVDALDGTARKVMLNEDLVGANDIVVRNDSIATVVSPMKELWLVKSIDSWAKGAMHEKVQIDLSWFPTSVVVGDKDMVYVLYKHLDGERMKGSGERVLGLLS
ncbi:hypothetical protein E2542_SST07818 [Spatholobus suberectus]|nr:hypothetical protein E2542_SST07818 [Spatholobus suberectus]